MKRYKIILLLVFSMLLPAAWSERAAAVEELPVVLLIQSYHSDNSWDKEYKSGLNRILDGRVRLISFEMDTKRLPRSMFPDRAEAAWQEYLRVNPDVVILGDDNALKYLGERFRSTSTPVVYLGINNNPRSYIPPGGNITGVLERPLLRRNILIIREIMGSSFKKGLLLFDDSTTAFVSMEQEFGGSRDLEIQGVAVHLGFFSDFSEWKKAVIDAPEDGYDAVIIGLFHTVKNDGRHVPGEEVLKWTSQHAALPLFCFWDFGVGRDGAVGGSLNGGKDQGVEAGRIVLRIFNGESPSEISPVTPEKGRYVFSQTQLDRWGLVLPRYIKSNAIMLP